VLGRSGWPPRRTAPARTGTRPPSADRADGAGQLEPARGQHLPASGRSSSAAPRHSTDLAGAVVRANFRMNGPVYPPGYSDTRLSADPAAPRIVPSGVYASRSHCASPSRLPPAPAPPPPRPTTAAACEMLELSSLHPSGTLFRPARHAAAEHERPQRHVQLRRSAGHRHPPLGSPAPGSKKIALNAAGRARAGYCPGCRTAAPSAWPRWIPVLVQLTPSGLCLPHVAQRAGAGRRETGEAGGGAGDGVGRGGCDDDRRAVSSVDGVAHHLVLLATWVTRYPDR